MLAGGSHNITLFNSFIKFSIEFTINQYPLCIYKNRIETKHFDDNSTMLLSLQRQIKNSTKVDINTTSGQMSL
jgi:hypothetical protein